MSSFAGSRVHEGEVGGEGEVEVEGEGEVGGEGELERVAVAAGARRLAGRRSRLAPRSSSSSNSVNGECAHAESPVAGSGRSDRAASP